MGFCPGWRHFLWNQFWQIPPHLIMSPSPDLFSQIIQQNSSTGSTSMTMLRPSDTATCRGWTFPPESGFTTLFWMISTVEVFLSSEILTGFGVTAFCNWIEHIELKLFTFKIIFRLVVLTSKRGTLSQRELQKTER